ncbi:MAG: adenylyltransferase/cytidyltransferase family protein [Promethearchaeia archaeon]
MVAGTFDIIHPGHIFLINEAAKLGNVFVVVATDKNAKRFKGQGPIIPEDQRLEVVRAIKNVKKAVLGTRKSDTLKTVEDLNPDIIMLGPDQKFILEKLKKGLKEKGLGHIKVKRLEAYYDNYRLHSSSLIKKKIIEEYKDKDEL